MRTTSWVVSALALASCWTAPKSTTPPPTAGGVDVEIASVTLADDCADPTAEMSRRAPGASEDMNMGDRACEQTAMQLSLTATGGGPTQIRIAKVELLGADGKPLGVLESRMPTVWNEGNGYVAWDQTIAGGQRVQASYKLSAPDWGAIPDGRWNASTTFHVRVTLVLGTQERTIEKQAIVRAMMEPDVVT